jgi:hypothetical protein
MKKEIMKKLIKKYKYFTKSLLKIKLLLQK